MDAFHRLEELMRNPDILEMADQSQSSKYYFRDTLELAPASPVLDTAEHFKVEQSCPNNSPHYSPRPSSSPSGVANPDITQVGQNSHKPSELISALPVLRTTENSQSNGSSLRRPPELIPSLDEIHTHSETQYRDDPCQPAEPIFTSSPVFNVGEQPKSTDDFLHSSEVFSSSPVVDTPDEIQISDDLRQPMELISTLPVANPATISQMGDDNPHQRQVRKLISNSVLLQTTERLQYSDYSLHRHVGLITNLPGIHYPDLSHSQLHQPPNIILGPPLLDNTALFKSNDQSLARCPELISSSTGIGTPDYTQSTENILHRSPESLTALSGLHTAHRMQFGDDYLHQPELHMPTPLFLGTVGCPQLIENSMHQFPDHVAQSESSDEEPEILPLQYARENGLSRDYLQTPYHTSNLNVFADYQDGLMDDSHLPQFKLSAEVNTDERLTISKDAALMIASATREEISEWVDDTMIQMISTSKYKIPRLELPLLKSDHETDCRKFAQREGFEINLQDVKLPLEIVDEDNNGGLGFSSTLREKGAELLEELKKERLEVSKDTLVYLQNVLRNDWTEEDEKNVWASTQTYKKRRALDPVTPPLSPMSFPAHPYEPSMSDPIFELPILSDPESLTKQDLEDIEKQIFDEDIPTPIKEARGCHDTSSDTLVGSDTLKLADLYSPAASLDRPPISPAIETKRVKREDLKVEEPLTPNRPIELPKSVRFSDTRLEWPVAAGSPPTDPFESSYFEEAFGDAHVKATRMSEQEALIAADTTARVKVPDMDFSMPNPPWGAIQGRPKPSSLLDMQRAIMRDSIGKPLPTWPGIGKVKVRYNPFPHDLAKVALEEHFFGDDSTWEAILNGSGDDEVIDTSTLTWKPPGLRILRDEDDGDEIEPGHFEKGMPQDLSFLAKKRKMEIEERGSNGDLVMQDPPAEAIAKQPPRKKTPKPTDFRPAAQKSRSNFRDTGGSLLMGETFSVGNSVENFLEIRGTKKPKLNDSSYFAKASAQEKAQSAQTKPKPQPELLMQLPIRTSPGPKANSPLPAPNSKMPNTPVNVIVASPFLKHRSLIKHIEALFPQIILVERDFSAHDTTVWMPGSVSRSPIASPLASEADIIVSPLVGIIITTLQKIKQKPLPGQKAKSAIRERLEKVSPRYERVILLVTEKREDETTRDLDESDCNAFSEFVGFALSLQTSIDIQFIGGGEATLAKWLVSVILQHRSEEELLADETHWELFLRRAGLNAFAAQHIIGILKAPDDVGMSSPSKAAHFGLAAFVKMGRDQRIAQFGPVCGNRLMARVSAVVDSRWS